MSGLSLQYFTFTNIVNLHFNPWNIALYLLANYSSLRARNVVFALCVVSCALTVRFPRSCSMSNNAIPPGDSLVFIFPLAPMLTFTSAVGKLNVRVLWHHHMLLQVISQRYCQVFVKSYNFVFEKIDKEGSPREKNPKQGHFCPRAMGILPPPKYPRVVKQPPKN